MKFYSFLGKIVELTFERQRHIVEFHPDIKNYFNRIQEVLMMPDYIRRSQYDREVLLFYKHYANILEGKYFVAVVKTNKRNFILTGYLTNRIMNGDMIL